MIFPIFLSLNSLNSVDGQVLIQLGESFEKGFKEIDSGLDVVSPGGFTNRMHRKHWGPDIHSSNTNL